MSDTDTLPPPKKKRNQKKNLQNKIEREKKQDSVNSDKKITLILSF